MKIKSLKEDEFAYRNIIITDVFLIVIAVGLTVAFGPIFLLLTLPFVYDLYHVFFYKERTFVSNISEIIAILP